MLDFVKDSKIALISHIADIDGMGSVVLANYFFNKEFDYYLVDSGEAIEALKKVVDKSYETIFICDLPLTDADIDFILKNNLDKKIKHFDHHESEVEKSNKYDFINEVIDIDGVLTCGTELFYNYLCSVDKTGVINNQFFKKFVLGVREQDTWTFKDENNSLGVDLASLLGLVGVEEYIKVLSNLDCNKEFEIPGVFGDLIKSQKIEKQKYIENAIKNCRIIEYMGLKMAVTVSESYRSSVGNDICLAYPDIDCCLIINFMRMRCSFRCTRNDLDLGLVCRKFESTGGGHKKAAGFTINEESLPKVKEILNMYLENL